MVLVIERVEDHVLKTDLVSSSKRRIYARVRELNNRKQQCRVLDDRGKTLSDKEIYELR